MSSFAQSNGIFRKPNLLPLPERVLLVKRMLGFIFKKVSKQGLNISKGEQMGPAGSVQRLAGMLSTAPAKIGSRG